MDQVEQEQNDEPGTRFKLPGFGLPLEHIPSGYTFPNATDTASLESGGAALPPLLTREITMLHIMNAITDKADWERKIFDEPIVATWRTEAQRLADGLADRDITPAMMDWCINELRYRSTLPVFKSSGGVSVFNGDVVKSDTAIDRELRDALREAVKPLEDVPEREKDWHPGSDGKVLDLVHPSLFPLVYGTTRILPDCLTSLEDFTKKCGEGEVAPIPDKGTTPSSAYWGLRQSAYSTQFQWLPCDVSVEKNAGGAVKANITSYINNIHPAKFPKLYEIIEDIIALAIPLWDATLTSAMYSNSQGIPVPRMKLERIRYRRHKRRRVLIQPDAPQWTEPVPTGEVVDLVEDYKDLGLQIIVKLANIHLTPDKPDYEGGSWHVEGQMNEHICTTALYYYDSENITIDRLAFRQQCISSVFDTMPYEQNDRAWLGQGYGLDNDYSAVQTVGPVDTREGRLITFPNILQHQVQPFKLADPTKPGHRKILALFLVDPNIDIISTACVPCQRRDWWSEEIKQQGTMQKLPVEVQDLVYDSVDEFPIGLEEAKQIRLELMEERKKFVLDNGRAFEAVEISLCEH